MFNIYTCTYRETASGVYIISVVENGFLH